MHKKLSFLLLFTDCFMIENGMKYSKYSVNVARLALGGGASFLGMPENKKYGA